MSKSSLWSDAATAKTTAKTVALVGKLPLEDAPLEMVKDASPLHEMRLAKQRQLQLSTLIKLKPFDCRRGKRTKKPK